MAYVSNPSNFHSIEKYIQTYNSETQAKVIKSPRCFVMDTCSIEFYKKVERPSIFAKYVNKNNGAVIIFRTVLMELAGDEGKLDQLQIAFFQTLSEAGVDIFVLYEEDIFTLLQVYTDNKNINKFLKYAVLCVKRPTGILEALFDNNNELKRSILTAESNSSGSIYSDLFNALRDEKKHEDDLGEIACLVCIHVLSNMEELTPYKYVFLTEDRTAVILASKVRHNALRHSTSSVKMIGIARFPTVIERMYHKGILKNAEDIVSFLGTYEGHIIISVKGEYDTDVTEKSYTVEEFAKFVCDEEGFVVM